MIQCDNDQCKVKWFHTECLRIGKVPHGKWFCPEYTKGKRGKKRKTCTDYYDSFLKIVQSDWTMHGI
jgi:hypothetical protein